VGTKDVAYFCPECGSASIEFSQLAGGRGSCNVCNWIGRREEMVGYAFEHDFSDGGEAVQYMLNDLRKVFAAASKLYGEFLMKWGFLEVKQTRGGVQLNTKQLSRYVASMALATFKAILETRNKMEQERLSGS
jgi:hypothetical protein